MHGKNPTHTSDSMVYSFLLVALVIEAPLAFGTGEGDADRCSAMAGMEIAGLVDGDRTWGIRGVIGLQNFRVAAGDYCGRLEVHTFSG